MGSLSLLQQIFPTQGLNPGLPYCRRILYQLSHTREACFWEGADISTIQANAHSLVLGQGLGTAMAPLGVSFHLLIEDQGLVLSVILVPFNSNQFMLCPWAISFLQKLCPAPFPPVTFPLRDFTPIFLWGAEGQRPIFCNCVEAEKGHGPFLSGSEGLWIPDLGQGQGSACMG